MKQPDFKALVYVFLNTVSYYNWIIYNHRGVAEIVKNLFFLLSADPRGIGFAFHRAGRA